MKRQTIRAGLALATLILWPQDPASALSIREWRKHDRDSQSLYIVAAISMAANMYAAQGDVVRASCVKSWYFGKNGQEPRGPHDLALEIGIAERNDPNTFQIEGVILGLIAKECSSQSVKP